MQMKRPNMSEYFRARIDYHVNGMLTRSNARMPHDVKRVIGDVTSRQITVVMLDGTEYHWMGGEYASRKVNLCYAPKMPKPGRRCIDCGAKGTPRDDEFGDVICDDDYATRQEHKLDPHKGHTMPLTGAWFCDTCNSPLCDRA